MRNLQKWTALVLFAVACWGGRVQCGDESAPAAHWPGSRDGLLFAFESASFRTPAFALNAEGKEILAYQLNPRGRAHFDRNHGLALAKGAYIADDVEVFLLSALKKSGALTLEAFITPATVSLPAPGEIISFSSEKDSKIALVQTDGDKLSLYLNTASSAKAPLVKLCDLHDVQFCHVVVTYANGQLTCYKNGAEVSRSKDITGDFSNWTPQHLIFGDKNWPGDLEGVAIFSRALTPAEVQADAKFYADKAAQRKPVETLVVKGKLLTATKQPEAKDLGPYSRALVSYEYEVEAVQSGKYEGKKIRVMHWGVMDRQPVPEIASRTVGTSYVLKLETFNENPQLQSEMLCDDLPVNADLEWYYDIEP